jgi:hypothetical protein
MVLMSYYLFKKTKAEDAIYYIIKNYIHMGQANYKQTKQIKEHEYKKLLS